MSTPNLDSPVSYRVNVAHLPVKGMPVWLEADTRQREALARDHHLVAVESFRFDLQLSRWQGQGVRISGRVKAAIVQTCVVTLDPLHTEIDEEVSALLLPEHSRLLRPPALEGGEMVLDAEGPDAPETFEGDEVDAGAVAEEFFGLAIDPYPRAKDAGLPTAVAPEETALEHGPLYEKLSALVRKQ